MTNQFNVLINFKSLANAAAFLQKEGLGPRSRNNLVNQCVGYLEALAEKHGCAVATDELSGVEFLIRNGLAGEVGKAAVKAAALGKRRELKEFDFVLEEALAVGKLNRKLGKKAELPADMLAPSEQLVLDAVESFDSEKEAIDYVIAAWGEKVLTASVREKVSELFKKS